jgi:hypothetical protein
MSNTIAELEQDLDCEAMVCQLPPDQTACPGGWCIVVSSPHGYYEICIEEQEFDCLKHLGVLTADGGGTDIRVPVIIDLLRKCAAD